MNYKDENKLKHLTLGAIGFIAFCFVATFADYPCAAGIFVKRIRIGSCDTE